MPRPKQVQLTDRLDEEIEKLTQEINILCAKRDGLYAARAIARERANAHRNLIGKKPNAPPTE